MAQLDAANAMPGNWLGLGLGLVNNNLKVKLLKVGLALSWPGIELGWHRLGGIDSAASKRTRPLCEAGFSALAMIKTKYRNQLQPEDDCYSKFFAVLNSVWLSPEMYASLI